jgi:hypothetical protein
MGKQTVRRYDQAGQTMKVTVADVDRFVVVVPNDTPTSRTRALTVRMRGLKTIEFDDFSSKGSAANSIERLVERLKQNVTHASPEHAHVGAA